MSNTVIIGAGIIGCATAFYLSETEGIDPSSIHLVEAAPEFFASASGKAAGFLAGDWFGPDVLPLGELSFDLHKQLAEKYDGFKQWGYSPSTGISYLEPRYVPPKSGEGPHDWLTNGSSRSSAAGQHEFGEGEGPTWLARKHGDTMEVIGQHGSVAQVDPLRLSSFLLQESRKRGVQVYQPAKVTKVTMGERNEPTGATIEYDDGTSKNVPCRRILLAAGCWTGRVFQSLFSQSKLEIPIAPYAGHTVVVHSPRYDHGAESKGCHAVFSTMSNGLSPEIMSRIGGDLWVAGLNSSTIPLPDLPTDAVIDKDAIAQLLDVSRKLLGDGTHVDDLVLQREGLCFRPVTPSGKPFVCAVPQKLLHEKAVSGRESGVFVAAGHGPWGIALSVGTGKVMAELLADKPVSANIDGLGLTL